MNGRGRFTSERHSGRGELVRGRGRGYARYVGGVGVMGGAAFTPMGSWRRRSRTLALLWGVH